MIVDVGDEVKVLPPPAIERHRRFRQTEFKVLIGQLSRWRKRLFYDRYF